MVNHEDFRSDGYSRELAIATKLEVYLSDCLKSLEPQALISCNVNEQVGNMHIRCQVDVDEAAFGNAERLIESEIRVVSRKDSAADAQIDCAAVIPAILKHENDSVNQIFQLIVRKVRLVTGSSSPAILPLSTMVNVDPNFGQPAIEIEHVIVLIHGIRDIGAWQSKVSRNLVQRGTVVEQIRYGYYPEIQFLFPIDRSNAPVKRVLKRLRALTHEYQNAKISVIAHSFGTYVFLKALEADSDLEFWKIIFCGSVADDQFEWSDLKRRVGDRSRASRDFVLNDCGTGDIWPILGAAFGWHYGMAGATGFSEGFVTNRFHRAVGGKKGGHSLYFDPRFVKEKWQPFLIDDVSPEHGDGEQGEHLPLLIRMLYHGWMRAICKMFALIIWLSLLSLLISIAVVIGFWLIDFVQMLSSNFSSLRKTQ